MQIRLSVASESTSSTINTLTGGSSSTLPNSPISKTVRFSSTSFAGRRVTHIGVLVAPDCLTTRKSSACNESGLTVWLKTTGIPSSPHAPKHRTLAPKGRLLSNPKKADTFGRADCSTASH